MTTRVRLLILTVVVLLTVGGTVGYLWKQHRDDEEAKKHVAPITEISMQALEKAPRIVFRNMNPATSYGAVGAVAVADPAGPRAILKTQCDRVYATAQRLLCLSSDRGLTTTYDAEVLDIHGLSSQLQLPLAGIPSRARLSRDGAMVATTSFAQGDSYAATSFSTRTVITQIKGTNYGSLEDFRLIHQGNVITPVDRNYWGVTFASDNKTFYVTAEWAQHTWLARGDLATRTITTLHEDAECPSLSPDGKHIVFKQRGDLPTGKWRLVSYDIASAKVTPLAETHSVDDQVEWLDNNTVIYGLSRTGAGAAVSDVWQVPANGTGEPKVLIPQAFSPAVVR